MLWLAEDCVIFNINFVFPHAGMQKLISSPTIRTQELVAYNAVTAYNTVTGALTVISVLSLVLFFIFCFLYCKLRKEIKGDMHIIIVCF